MREGKYARIERERRFLLAGPPEGAESLTARQITDRYLIGTRLRLRWIQREDGDEYKLTQKVPSPSRPGTQGLITNTYLNRIEYDLLATLPAIVLAKTRISVPPMGVDVFRGPLEGLVVAEVEFTSDEACDGFVPPWYCLAEVTTDARFTGGRLAQTERSDLLSWLAEFGLGPTGQR